MVVGGGSLVKIGQWADNDSAVIFNMLWAASAQIANAPALLAGAERVWAAILGIHSFGRPTNLLLSRSSYWLRELSVSNPPVRMEKVPV